MTNDLNQPSDHNQPSQQKPVGVSNGKLFVLQLLIVTTLVAICIIGLVTITIMRPESDNAVIITAIIGFTTTTIASLLGLIASQKNAGALREVHYSLNSRMDQLVKNATLAATGEEKARALEERRSEERGAQKERDSPTVPPPSSKPE